MFAGKWQVVMISGEAIVPAGLALPSLRGNSRSTEDYPYTLSHGPLLCGLNGKKNLDSWHYLCDSIFTAKRQLRQSPFMAEYREETQHQPSITRNPCTALRRLLSPVVDFHMGYNCIIFI